MFPITYRQFQIEVEAVIPDSKVVRLNPSVTVILNQNSLLQGSALGWVQPIGEQNVDYKFDRDNKALSTAEIAKHFAPLTNEQAQRVYEYCQVGLLEKFRSLEQQEDIYFRNSRF